jgi:hypothetical protein
MGVFLPGWVSFPKTQTVENYALPGFGRVHEVDHRNPPVKADQGQPLLVTCWMMAGQAAEAPE